MVNNNAAKTDDFQDFTAYTQYMTGLSGELFLSKKRRLCSHEITKPHKFTEMNKRSVSSEVFRVPVVIDTRARWYIQWKIYN